MITFVLIMTILNTVVLGHYVWKIAPFEIEIRKVFTEYGKVCTGYEVILWKKITEGHLKRISGFIIPIKNHKKANLQARICFLISISEGDRQQRLHAQFSWLKTRKEVEAFKRDYIDVDRKLVERLVADWAFNNSDKL